MQVSSTRSEKAGHIARHVGPPAPNLGNAFGYFEGCDPNMPYPNDAYHPNEGIEHLTAMLDRGLLPAACSNATRPSRRGRAGQLAKMPKLNAPRRFFPSAIETIQDTFMIGVNEVVSGAKSEEYNDRRCREGECGDPRIAEPSEAPIGCTVTTLGKSRSPT
jgi:hypothetical protein